MPGRAAWVETPVALPRLTLNLRELSAPGPALLLLHGLGVDGTVWQAIGRRLRPTFHVLAPDLRGHGASHHPPAGYHARDYAADIAQLLDTLADAYGAIHVLGHSLGALAALGATAMNPSAVQRLVLEDPPLQGPGPLAPYLSAVLAAKRQSRSALVEVVQRFQPELGDLIGGIQAAMWERTADGALRAILDEPATVFDADGWLGQVDAPTLLMAADPALDARLRPEAAQAAVRALRDGQFVTFPGVGHVIHARSPGAFCAVVTDFLRQ